MSNTNCYYCDYCYYCYDCYYCDYCDSCYSCDYCYYSKNLRMTEYNIFCYSKNYNDENSFQQERYRVFNKCVGDIRFYEIKRKINSILKNENNLKLKDFWEQVTNEQWRKLLEIPEAKDFKEGFEYISRQNIELDDKVEISCEGKIVKISRESARALNLI